MDSGIEALERCFYNDGLQGKKGEREFRCGRNGLMAELGLGFSEGVGDSDGKLVEKVSRVEKVTMGVLNVFSCRYVNVDEGLRYLQSFLPHNALSNVSYCKLKTQIVPKVMHLNVN
ncbi:hypothetical protein GIB67_024695 [Kingdonia uniflora]|uniref:Uncharacterized protein n=1 Tax=Kingdonia uniflora TaxID=39325 RepID=A0A7J7LPJ1_9MAGN|nr:hypothetical protein GIB67_024695 [Kingdonia uniflora]